MIQLQIKAFNKAYQRAQKADKVSDEIYEAISDMIGYDRMTKSGAGKAGTKYLESMTEEELLAYSADIEVARDLLKLDKIIDSFDLGDAKDVKSLLWKMYDDLQAQGMPFDSDQVYAIAEGEIKADWKQLVIQMNKYKNDPEYMLADVDEWFNSLVGLE
jgi:hypothetical protein